MGNWQTHGPRDNLMKRGEIWLVDLDPTQGHEQKGRRPVLIVSPEAFNKLMKVPVVLPITSGGSFARTAGFAVSLAGAGTKTTGVVRCDQPRALDLVRSWRQKTRSHSPRDRRRSIGKVDAAVRITPRPAINPPQIIADKLPSRDRKEACQQDRF